MRGATARARAASPGPLGDRVLKLVSWTAGVFIVVVLGAVFVELVWHSRLSIARFGFRFLVSEEWNPATGEFGALSSIYGTVVATIIAMVLAAPTSVLLAVGLVELAPGWLAKIVGQAVELLAAIPSIIYGMWGLFVLGPLMADYVQPALSRWLGFLPLFEGPPMGIGMLTAGVVLAVMVLPYMTAVVRDVLVMTPRELKEAAYGMGATTWEVTTKITLRHGMKGVVGGMLVGLGRALGETMAVTFVIGNTHQISASLFMPANTITSTLANEFAEAADPLYLSALTELGLILLLITFAVGAITQLVLGRYASGGRP